MNIPEHISFDMIYKQPQHILVEAESVPVGKIHM
jgi:hypothetical protein